MTIKSDKYHEDDRYPIKGWHDAFNEVAANSVMLYYFGTDTINPTDLSVTLHFGSHMLRKGITVSMSMEMFIGVDHVVRLAYIREMEQQLHESIIA